MSRSRYSRRLYFSAYWQKLRESFFAFIQYIKINPIKFSAMVGGTSTLCLFIIGLALIPGMLFPVVATGAFIINLTSAIVCSYYGVRLAPQNLASVVFGGFVGFLAGSLACTIALKLLPSVLTYAVCLTVVGSICTGIAALASAMTANSVVRSIEARERENQRQIMLNEREQEALVNNPPASPEEGYRRIQIDTSSSTVLMHASLNTNPFADDVDSYTEFSSTHTPESGNSLHSTPLPDPHSENSEEEQVEGAGPVFSVRSNSR